MVTLIHIFTYTFHLDFEQDIKHLNFCWSWLKRKIVHFINNKIIKINNNKNYNEIKKLNRLPLLNHKMLLLCPSDLIHPFLLRNFIWCLFFTWLHRALMLNNGDLYVGYHLIGVYLKSIWGYLTLIKGSMKMKLY